MGKRVHRPTRTPSLRYLRKLRREYNRLPPCLLFISVYKARGKTRRRTHKPDSFSSSSTLAHTLRAMRLAIRSFAIIGIYVVVNIVATNGETSSTPADPKTSPNEKEQNSTSATTWRFHGSICPHKDHKSYVRCLQRHRRHNAPLATVEILSPGKNGASNGGSNCMEECERESCRRSQVAGPCAEICYDRCLKKTKEIHHRITEYESACNDGENCDENGGKTANELPWGFGPIANLTTSIDIRNYLNNTNVILTNPQTGDKAEKGGRGDVGNERKDDVDRWRKDNATCRDKTGHDNPPREPGFPRRPSPGFQPWFPSPSLSLIPQIQMVPQVTFGIGIGSGIGFGSIGNGCPYTNIWLCFSQQQQQQQQIRVDCSGCEHPYPYQRGRCDPSC
ncbi:uncharacterized protein LOC105688692 [Athalia rosae]|uniref:uncharacterized protein LOC105688692 n=1 Tax=Athalia rosae TaxID=37344 RepID=UPI0020333440|nr:uncharacterized protein LOC105688692 [Athalia rosae]